MESNQSRYRKGVGIMLINKDCKVFVGQRVKESSEAWQMPQGGIDEGENSDEALMRELLEEVGTNNIEIIYSSTNWYTYNIPLEFVPKWWGDKYIGQQQKWYLAKFLGNDSEININTESPEFVSWRWVDIDELPELIVSFKRELYQDIIKEFRPILTALCQL